MEWTASSSDDVLVMVAIKKTKDESLWPHPERLQPSNQSLGFGMASTSVYSGRVYSAYCTAQMKGQLRRLALCRETENITEVLMRRH